MKPLAGALLGAALLPLLAAPGAFAETVGYIGADGKPKSVSPTTPLPTGPASSTGAYAAATIGATSAQALAAGTATIFLDIVNESPTATIACAFGITAVINGAGSITIPPLFHRSWEGTFVPPEAINCIASAAGTPATIGAK